MDKSRKSSSGRTKSEYIRDFRLNMKKNIYWKKYFYFYHKTYWCRTVDNKKWYFLNEWYNIRYRCQKNMMIKSSLAISIKINQYRIVFVKNVKVFDMRSIRFKFGFDYIFYLRSVIYPEKGPLTKVVLNFDLYPMIPALLCIFFSKQCTENPCRSICTLSSAYVIICSKVHIVGVLA